MKFKVLFAVLGVFILAGCESQEPVVQEKEAVPAQEEEQKVVTPIPSNLNIPETVEMPGAVEELRPKAEVAPEPVVEEAKLEAASESKEILLAKCMTASGAKLYTASWCGHCKNQKAAFKDGLEYLDNTECASENGWTQECKNAGVEAVPTWIFGDGTMQSGNTPLATLASLTGCSY